MFTALATGAARATARRRLPALAAVFVIVAAFAPMVSPLTGVALAGSGGPALTPPTAESAAPDPAEPHGFLDDSTTGTPGGGISPAVTTPPTLAPGFSSSIVLSGLTNPTAVRFASDGSVWVTQKNGKIMRYSSLSATTPTVFADLSAEVNQYWDHGMMGLALAPNFPTDPSIYVLYSYDHNPVHDYIPSAPSTWNDGCPTPPGLRPARRLDQPGRDAGQSVRRSTVAGRNGAHGAHRRGGLAPLPESAQDGRAGRPQRVLVAYRSGHGGRGPR